MKYVYFTITAAENTASYLVLMVHLFNMKAAGWVHVVFLYHNMANRISGLLDS